MPQVNRPSPDAAQRANLEAFVVRARRVEAHSLAQDLQALQQLAAGRWQLVHDGRTVRMSQELPPEEVIESAAARVRPLLLKSEHCHYGKALTAIGYFVRDGSIPAQLQQLRARWKARVEEGGAERSTGYRVLVHDAATGERGDMDDVRLAHAWIYGDVVHHDPHRRMDADPFGLKERFRAAVPLVAWTMCATIGLLRSIRTLQTQGRLELARAAFEEPVVLTTTTFVQEAKVYMAPEGTRSPTDATTPFTEEWVELTGPEGPAHP